MLGAEVSQQQCRLELAVLSAVIDTRGDSREPADRKMIGSHREYSNPIGCL